MSLDLPKAASQKRAGRFCFEVLPNAVDKPFHCMNSSVCVYIDHNFVSIMSLYTGKLARKVSNLFEPYYVHLFYTESTPKEVRMQVCDGMNERALLPLTYATEDVSEDHILPFDVRTNILQRVASGNLCTPPSFARWNGKCDVEVDKVIEPPFVYEEKEEMGTRSRKGRTVRSGTLSHAHMVICATQMSISPSVQYDGFVTFYVNPSTPKEDPFLYIELLCASKDARGLGTLLLGLVEQMARFLTIPRIRLSALDYVIGSEEECRNGTAKGLLSYYRKHGFVEIPDVPAKDPHVVGILMEKVL